MKNFHFRYEYLRTPATELVDGGRDLLEKQSGFQLINPSEKWFPGLSELKEQYASWDWRFGKTPKFTVIKDFTLKSAASQHDIKVSVEVDKVSFFLADSVQLSKC